MDKGFKSAIIIWLIAISVISLSALCRTFYNGIPLKWDMAALLVGILAVLCTVLIGWQIYTVVDYSQREKANASKIAEINDYLNNAKREELYRNYLSHYAIADIYAHLCNGVVVKRLDYECAKNRIEALYYAAILEDWETCKLIASMANRFVDQRKSRFNPTEIEELRRTLLSMNSQNFSEEFCKLLSTFQRILDA